MRNKTVILGILLLIGIVTIFASTSHALSPILVYNFSEDNQTYVSDFWGNINLTRQGAETRTTYPTYAVSGDGSPHSLYFNGTHHFVNGSIHSLTNFSGNFSISLWTKLSAKSTYRTLSSTWYAANSGMLLRFDTNTNNLQFLLGNTTHSNLSNLTNAVVYDTWTHIGIVVNKSSWNRSVVNLYINNSAKSSRIFTVSSNDNTKTFNIGSMLYNNAQDAFYFGHIDEFRIYDDVLSASEISDIYNTGYLPPLPPRGPSIRLNLSSGYSLGDGMNISVFLNGTRWPELPTICGVYWNTTDVQCYPKSVNGINETFDCTITGERDEPFQVYAQCNATLYNYTNVEEIMHYTWIDTALPMIVLQNFTNHTQAYQIIHGSFQWQDSNLYRLNVTIDDTLCVWNVTAINATTYLWAMNYNVSSLSVGQHVLNLTMWDAHTAQELKQDWNVQKLPIFSNKITFYTSQNSITIESMNSDSILDGNPFKKWERLKDRLTWTYEPTDDKKDKYIFNVVTHKPLQVVGAGTGKYGGEWLISGENWIDFNTGSQEQKVKIKLINDYAAEVTITGLKGKTIQTYKSVGELNKQTLIYNFTRYNVSMYYYTPVMEGEEVSSALKVDYGDAPITYTSAFRYNTTLYTVNPSNGTSYLWLNSTYTVPLIPNYTMAHQGKWWLNTTYDNLTFEFLQHVIQLRIDNCSNYTTQMINLSVWDEDAPTTHLNAGVNVNFDYGINSPTVRNASFIGGGTWQYQYCFFPGNVTFQVNAYFKYTTTNGFTHRYYMQNESVNSSVTNIHAYNFNTTTDISVLQGTTRYAVSYNYYPLILAKLLRYYPGENIYRTVQHSRSDDYGSILFNIKEKGTDYVLKYYDETNNLLKTTNLLKFYCTAGVCTITVVLTPSTDAEASHNLKVNSTFNNETGIISVYWYDDQAATNTVRMYVDKVTLGGNTSICIEEGTGSQGNLTCNITGYTGTFIVQVIAEHSPFTYAYSWIYEYITSTLYNIIDYREGILLGVLTFGTIVMAGITSPAVVVMSASLGLIVLLLFGFSISVTLMVVVVGSLIAVFIALKVRN